MHDTAVHVFISSNFSDTHDTAVHVLVLSKGLLAAASDNGSSVAHVLVRSVCCDEVLLRRGENKTQRSEHVTQRSEQPEENTAICTDLKSTNRNRVSTPFCHCREFFLGVFVERNVMPFKRCDTFLNVQGFVKVQLVIEEVVFFRARRSAKFRV